MFQFASTFSIAKTLGYEVVFPSQYHDLHCFDLDFESLFTDKPIVTQFLFTENSSDFNFEPNVFRLPDNCSLQGYFQSLGYISPNELEIREMLKFKNEIKEKADQKLKDLGVYDSKKISVHVRRGDYLNIPDVLPVCDLSYYLEAIPLAKSKLPESKIVIFSDDIEWCRENLKFDNCVFSDSLDHSVDMCMMSMCDAHVIANSSFSWWGAWLSESSQVVVRPKRWYGPGGPKVCGKMFLADWISL